MQCNKVIIMIFGAFISHSLEAGSMGTGAPASWAQVMTLSIGPAWTDSNETQTLYLQPEIQKTYAATKKTTTLLDGEFFYGWQHAINPIFSGQIGLAFAATSNAKLSGDIWEDADPDFNNFYYNYKVSHAHLAAKGKLLADVGQIVTPYISASLGIGLNRAHDFIITPKIIEEVPAPAFADYTTTALTYTLGIGLQKALTANIHIGIGYEFADWGKSSLTRAQGQTLSDGLQLNHLYINELQFSLSYIA